MLTVLIVCLFYQVHVTRVPTKSLPLSQAHSPSFTHLISATLLDSLKLFEFEVDALYGCELLKVQCTGEFFEFLVGKMLPYAYDISNTCCLNQL